MRGKVGGWAGGVEGGGQPGGAVGDDPVVVVEDDGGGLAHDAEGDPEYEVADLVVAQRLLQPPRRKHQRHLRASLISGGESAEVSQLT